MDEIYQSRTGFCEAVRHLRNPLGHRSFSLAGGFLSERLIIPAFRRCKS